MEATESKTCPACGAALPAGATFCPACAKEITARESVSLPKKRRWRRVLPVCLAAIVVLAVAAVIAVPKIRAAWAASRPAPLVTDVHWTDDGDFGWTMPKGGKAYS